MWTSLKSRYIYWRNSVANITKIENLAWIWRATYTCVPLSPSSKIWYWPRGLISVAGKVTAGLVEINGSLPPGLWLSLAGWLPRNRDQLEGIFSKFRKWVCEPIFGAPSFSLPPLDPLASLFFIFSPPLTSPLTFSIPSPPLEVGPLNPARVSGERSKLPHRGLGWSPSRNWIWCILVLKSDIWCLWDLAMDVQTRRDISRTVVDRC